MSIGKDKFLHAIVCFFATAIGSIATFWLGEVPCLFCGGLFALGLGLGKEYGDSKASGNHWEWGDIIADVIGIALAVVILMIALRD